MLMAFIMTFALVLFGGAANAYELGWYVDPGQAGVLSVSNYAGTDWAEEIDVTPGTTFDMTLQVKGVAEDIRVSAFEMGATSQSAGTGGLYYDSSQFAWTDPGEDVWGLNTTEGMLPSAHLDPAMWYFNPHIDTRTEGIIGVWAGNWNMTTPVDFDAVTIDLQCTAIGSETFDFSEGNELFVLYYAGSGSPMSPDEIYGMTVNNVPIPSALLLLGSGLVGLVGMRKKQKANG